MSNLPPFDLWSSNMKVADIAEGFVLGTSLFISNGIQLFASNVIRSYHGSKPLGLQSLLSKVIIMFTYSFDIFTASVTFWMAVQETFGQLTDAQTVFAAILAYLVSAHFYLCVDFILITKYALIYHRQVNIWNY